MRTEPGKYPTFCPECGFGVTVDEDGLCIGCGCSATGKGVDALFQRPVPEVVAEWGHGKVITAGVRENDPPHRFGLWIREVDIPHEVGEIAYPEMRHGDEVEWEPGDKVMWFTKPESLDIVLEDLLDGRKMMGWGEYPTTNRRDT